MSSTRRTFLRHAGCTLSLGTLGAGLGFALPRFTLAQAPVAPSGGLPRSNPAKEGVLASGILDVLEGIEQAKIELHSFMMLPHGRVIAEGWWEPYGPQFVHTMYSLSKSFTSMAVGFAVAEGKMSVEDKVLSFFPE